MPTVVTLGFIALLRWSSPQEDWAFSELADLHAATLASSNPVDVISSDRHTVKPWFREQAITALDLQC